MPSPNPNSPAKGGKVVNGPAGGDCAALGVAETLKSLLEQRPQQVRLAADNAYTAVVDVPAPAARARSESLSTPRSVTIRPAFSRSRARRKSSRSLAPHAAAWRDFTKKIGVSKDVGVWHELYTVRPGDFEAVYSNMPVFGMAGAGEHLLVGNGTRTSKQRMAAGDS